MRGRRKSRLNARKTRRVRRRRTLGGEAETLYTAATGVVDARNPREAVQSKARLTDSLSKMLKKDPRSALNEIDEVFANTRAALEAELSQAMDASPKERAAIVAKLKALDEKRLKVTSAIAKPKSKGWSATAWNAVAGIAATAVIAAVSAAAYHYAAPETKSAVRGSLKNASEAASNYGKKLRLTTVGMTNQEIRDENKKNFPEFFNPPLDEKKDDYDYEKLLDQRLIEESNYPKKKQIVLNERPMRDFDIFGPIPHLNDKLERIGPDYTIWKMV